MNRRRGRNSGVRESGMKDRWVWFRGSHHLRIDDPGNDSTPPRGALADSSVREILGGVTVGVGHNDDGDPGATQGFDRLHRAGSWLAPQDLAGVASIGKLSQGIERILRPGG